MSFEVDQPPEVDPSGLDQTSASRFRRAMVVTLATLVVAVAGLSFANVERGPRLLGAEVDPRLAVERTGQRLVLKLDQAVRPVDGAAVDLRPGAQVDVTSGPAEIDVSFAGTLPYATTYRLRVGVRSLTTGTSSTLSYSFRTPDPVVYLLRRGQRGPDGRPADQIVQTAAGGAERVVYTAPRIQEFAVSETSLAVVGLNAHGDADLSLRPLGGGGVVRSLAHDAQIGQLQSVSPGGLFGFVLTPKDRPAAAQLQIYDPASAAALTPVVGFDRKPLVPQQWAFVPGTSSIIAQTDDASFYLIDPFQHRPTRPLGAHLVLHGFIRNSAIALFEDPGHLTTIDLATGKTAELPPPRLPRDASLNELFPLPGQDRYVGLEAVLVDRVRYRVVSAGAEGVTPLYTPADPDAVISHTCLSPNGQYVAVQAAPQTAVSDEYPNLPSYVDATTTFVDTSTGAAATVTGIFASWCS